MVHGWKIVVAYLFALLFSGAGVTRAALHFGGQTPPIELGFEDGDLGSIPVDWFVPTPGWSAGLTEDAASSGERSLMLRLDEDGLSPFGNIMTKLDAEAYRGRRVTLMARIRADGGEAMMWLRSDLEDGTAGAFDNMGDRPIRGEPGNTTWADATIELTIEPDASELALGFMAVGGATLLIDDVRLEAGDGIVAQEPSEPRPLSARGRANLEAATRLLSYVRFFHPSDQAVAVDAWDHFAVMLMEHVEPATDADDLAARLSQAFASVAPTVELWVGAPSKAPARHPLVGEATRIVSWHHTGAGRIGSSMQGVNAYASRIVSEPLQDGDDRAGRSVVKVLGGGICCRLPVALHADGEGTLPHMPIETAWASPDDHPRLTVRNRATRLAGVAVCWGIMQHFYPYFDVIESDWDDALGEALGTAATDIDEVAYVETLQRLVAKLEDGHGYVAASFSRRTMLPFTLSWAGEDLVITGRARAVPSEIEVGDVITEIDGVPIEEWVEELSARVSAATDGWRRTRLLELLLLDLPTAEVFTVRVRHPDGTTSRASMDRIAPSMLDDVTRDKPADGSEVAPGIVYFDLDRASADELARVMDELSGADGIIFDLRGYPGDGAFHLMGHLCEAPITSAQWHIPVVTLPDGEGWGWNQSGRWSITPTSPYLGASIAFLTDGRAISYAESIMGIVENYGMGEIVGATTAGTNGNINPFGLPGGITINWTGMKVLKHDGSRHHGVGISPTVPVEPTAAGIASGRDEVLERAVEVLRGIIEAEDSSPD